MTEVTTDMIEKIIERITADADPKLIAALYDAMGAFKHLSADEARVAIDLFWQMANLAFLRGRIMNEVVPPRDLN